MASHTWDMFQHYWHFARKIHWSLADAFFVLGWIEQAAEQAVGFSGIWRSSGVIMVWFQGLLSEQGVDLSINVMDHVLL